MNAFTRVAAILVGLANLAVLIMLKGVDPVVQRGDVVWSQALLLVVLAVVVAGLLTSEIVLRWFKQSALAEECSERCGVVIGAVCLGGASMGGLLVPALALGAVLAGGESEITPAAGIGGIDLPSSASFTGQRGVFWRAYLSPSLWGAYLD